jgi:pyridoxine 5-phosphate synthase
LHPAKSEHKRLELHTGNYANAKSEKQSTEMLEVLKEGVKIAQDAGLMVNAGHGLTYKNTGPIVRRYGCRGTSYWTQHRF